MTDWVTTTDGQRGFPVKKQAKEDGSLRLQGTPRCQCWHGVRQRGGVCRTSEHESHHLKEFVRPGTRRVYADEGYAGNRQYLGDEAILDGIMAKASRGHSLTEQEQKHDARIVKNRRIVEGVFASWKQWY